jgi:GAF domain-containing protein
MEGTEAPREHAFCNYTIREHKPLIVPDTTKDPRFESHAYVLVENGVRFYAGIPLATCDGNNIGTFCLVDTKPREFDTEQVALLSDLARMVMDELELRMLL